MLVLNVYRASESPKGSIQRMHYVQSAFSNLFALALLTAGIGTLLTVMLFPVAPVIGAAFAGSAVALTCFDVLWRMIPPNGKRVIKGWFHLGKPDLTADATDNQDALSPEHSIHCDKEPKHHRLFSCADYSAVIRKMDAESAKDYLSKLIHHKLKTFEQNQALHDEKTKDKV
ncbi:MAG: hypothetical protein ACRCXC_05675 [Legionella sp.]